MNSIWHLKTCDELLAKKISSELNISLLLSRLLVQRGITSPAEARYFLNPDLKCLIDPMAMSGMQAAAERILKALNDQEKIVIYGDYDADGVCSVVLLKECLARLGYEADYYVPNRFNEGYGLNQEAIEELARQGYKLIITVDCGISSVEEAELVRQLGMELVITDHHTPPAVQPDATAIVNPKNDDLPALSNLAGVGVAYKLACALLQSRGKEVGQEWLDLVALATVADIVPLLEENRILVKYGLEALEKTRRPGLKALLHKTSLYGKKLESWHIGFMLAPRLNSAGRLDSARISIELLLSRDESRADQLAAQLCGWNDERKSIEDRIYQQAIADIESNVMHNSEAFILTGGEHWHEGVIGIVASRLANHYNRPAIVISWDGDKGKGSARGSSALDLYSALTYCQDYLEQFGGHKMAAGLSLKKENLLAFKQALQDYMEKEGLGEPGCKIVPVDMEIDAAEIDPNLLNEILRLSPFGEGNPVPRFLLRASELHDPALVGAQREHFKCKTGSNYLEAIAFNRADLMAPVIQTCKQDMLFELSENTFKGRTSLQLKIKDMRSSFCPDYLHGKDNNSAQLVSAIQRTADELAEGRPVLFIYPGYRSLSKHLSLLRGLFKAEHLQEWHGLLAVSPRSTIRKQFRSGQGKLFLTTRAFINGYCEHNRLPEALRYAVVLWPIEEPGMESFHNVNMEIDIINNHQPGLLKSSPEWSCSLKERTIIYANRPATIKGLSQSQAGMEIESGLADAWQRMAVRRRFINAAAGMLMIDGTHPFNPAQMGRIDNFILADSPFGHYELAAVADYWDNADIPLRLSFSKQDVEKNRLYLERIYPEGEQVQAIWHQLIHYGKTKVRSSEEQLAARLAADMQRELRPLDLIPALRILADLDLCQFQKSDSIMEIKLLKTSTDKLNLQNSPYYLEGRGEKNLLASWEQSLNNNLVW